MRLWLATGSTGFGRFAARTNAASRFTTSLSATAAGVRRQAQASLFGGASRRLPHCLRWRKATGRRRVFKRFAIFSVEPLRSGEGASESGEGSSNAATRTASQPQLRSRETANTKIRASSSRAAMKQIDTAPRFSLAEFVCPNVNFRGSIWHKFPVRSVPRW